MHLGRLRGLPKSVEAGSLASETHTAGGIEWSGRGAGQRRGVAGPGLLRQLVFGLLNSLLDLPGQPQVLLRDLVAGVVGGQP